MRKIIGKVAPTAAAVAVATILSAGGGAYAAHLVSGGQIQNGTITGVDVKDGSLRKADLASGLKYEMGRADTAVQPRALDQYARKSDIPKGADLSGYAKKSDLTDLANKSDLTDLANKSDLTDLANKSDLADLQTKVDALQAQVSSDWVQDAGTVAKTNDGLVVTEGQDDTAGAGASKNTLIEYSAGDKITVSGKLSEGARAGQGAPRAYVVINGVVYTSVDNVNPDYGTSADGSDFTEALVPVSYSGEKAPRGLITQVGVAYDNTSAPGTATFTSLKIGSHNVPLS